MGPGYLNGKKWEEITRDERFFCAHLYFELNRNISPLLEFLGHEKIISAEELNPSIWEVGFEVCFFRDFVFEIGEQNANKSIKKSAYSQKRTFDLCLFSEQQIIIIEAKSHTGFNTKQLDNFNTDKKNIASLLGVKCPSISSIALFSESYKPKPGSLEGFNCQVTWKQLFDMYSNPIFLRANKSKLVVKND